MLRSHHYAVILKAAMGAGQPINLQESRSDTKNEVWKVALVSSISSVVLIFVIGPLFWLVRRRLQLARRDLIREEENQVYLQLSSEEQELYFQSKEFLESNPYLRGDLTLSQNLSIQEKGVNAWEFIKDPMLTNNDLMILNRTELNFFKNYEYSVQTNLPVPMKNEVYYFESKMYSLPNPEETIVSMGFSVKPYPWFRLPGRHANSISYDSNGYRRFNMPLKVGTEPPFPALVEGDVVGVGYRVRSGTVFFTKNGKKISELKIGGHIKNFKVPHNGQIFPTIGANNLCSVHVNLGQMGFVFIEGNVKKWGFGPLEGNGPAPPAYNKFNSDILLERSEIDDENDLSERENDFPPNFWEINKQDEESSRGYINDKFSYDAYGDLNSQDERISLASIPVHPPSYDIDNLETSSKIPLEESDTGANDSQDASSSVHAESNEARRASSDPPSSTNEDHIEDNVETDEGVEPIEHQLEEPSGSNPGEHLQNE